MVAQRPPLYSPAAWEITPAGGRNTWFRQRERVRLHRRVHGAGGGGHRAAPPWGRSQVAEPLVASPYTGG